MSALTHEDVWDGVPDPRRDRAAAAFVTSMVALATGVPAREIAAPTRARAPAARAAQDRIARALAAAGPGLREMLEHVCRAGTALEAAERSLGLPRRSGKAILKLALQRLAQHYGLA